MAVTKCVKCGKPLCLECRQQIRTSTRTNYQYQQFGGDLCPTCCYTELKRISRTSWCGYIFVIVFVGVFIAISSVGFTQLRWASIFFIGFPVLILIIMTYSQFISAPRKLRQMQETAERLEGGNLGSSGSISNNIPSFSASSHDAVRFCKYCGNTLRFGDTSCSRCSRFTD